MPPPSRKLLLRLANRIQAELEQQAHQGPSIELPEVIWERCQRLHQQLLLAQSRGWQGAARRRQEELNTATDGLRAELTHVLQPLSQKQLRIASLRDLVLDLAALHKEFVEVQWNLNDGTLSVTTEPISLNDQYLGPFCLELQWQRLDAVFPYRVIALEPQPASRDPTVTHPHVQDEVLCEGEGKAVLRSALRSGRLFDFFCLIASILRTYNASSAYVDLHEWNGSTCSDCGGSFAEDDGSSCCRCEEALCQECSVCCACCNDSFCSGCTDSCAGCHESLCNACLDSCGRCDARSCRTCLSHNNLCETCDEQEDTTPEPASLTGST